MRYKELDELIHPLSSLGLMERHDESIGDVADRYCSNADRPDVANLQDPNSDDEAWFERIGFEVGPEEGRKEKGEGMNEARLQIED